MKTFEIDAYNCQSANDLYALLLSVLDAPDWHERNLDALWDSITSDINGLSPPYLIKVSGHERVPAPVLELLTSIQSVFDEAQHDRSIEVALLLV